MSHEIFEVDCDKKRKRCEDGKNEQGDAFSHHCNSFVIGKFLSLSTGSKTTCRAILSKALREKVQKGLPRGSGGALKGLRTTCRGVNQDTGYRIQDTGYRIQDTGYRIQDTDKAVTTS
ncbi:MAG: hypothetical protein LLG06_04130 [Desulfobacteraceae bacterium]|nr:hypothetical protein [Desulfobacteraceae bacterium]